MIQHFESPHMLEPRGRDHFQWPPALKAGLIAGAILLIVPRGSPWSALTFFAPVVVGRVIPELGVPLVGAMALHIAVSLIYGVIISLAVKNVTQMRAVMVGGLVGLALYFANLGLVSAAFPELRGSEVSVAFTHVVFGAITAGAYRGLLRREPETASTVQQPPS